MLMEFYVRFFRATILSLTVGLLWFPFWNLSAQSLSRTVQIQHDSLLQLIARSSSDSLIMEYYNQLRRVTTFEWPEKALEYNREYGRRAKLLKIDSKVGVSKAYDATLFIPMGRYSEALESLFIAEEVFDSLDNQAALGSIYNSLGAVYQRMKRDSFAKVFYNKSYSIANQRDDAAREAIALSNLSELYFQEGDFLESKKTMEIVLATADVLHPDYLPRYQLIYANTLIELFDYEKAKNIYSQILASSADVNAFIIAETHLGLGKLNNRLRKAKEALNNLELALSISEKQGFAEVERAAHEELVKANELSLNYSKALLHMREFKDLSDSLNSVESDRDLALALTEFEAEKKEQEIQLLQSENEIKDLRISKDKRAKTYLGIGFVGLLLLMGLGGRLYLVQKRGNTLLKDKNAIISANLKEKEVLLKEIHHRVKNNLQVISSLLKLQSQHIKDENAIRAISEGRNRVNSMAILHQNLYSYEDVRGVDMKKYFENLIQNLFDAYNIQTENVSLFTHIDDMTLDIDTVIPLGLIANELVANSLQHAFDLTSNAELQVSLWEQDDALFFKVKDNGVGYTPIEDSSQSEGFGKKLIHLLAARLEGELQYVQTRGTEVVLKILDYQKVI